MTVPLLPLPWQESWVTCERCGAYLLAEDAVVVDVLDGDRYLEGVAHADRDVCRKNLT